VSGKAIGQTNHPSGLMSWKKSFISRLEMTVNSTWRSRITLSTTDPRRFPLNTTKKSSSTVVCYTTLQTTNLHFSVSPLKKTSIWINRYFQSICHNRATGLAATEKTYQMVRSMKRVSTVWWSWMTRAYSWRELGVKGTTNSRHPWRWPRVRWRQATTQSWLTQLGTNPLV